MSSNILSIAMRPKSFTELIGQKDIVIALSNQFSSGRIPHFFIFSGEVGSGKTTFARLLAVSLQKNCHKLTNLDEKDWQNKSFDIQEINAANKTSVDDIRQLIEKLKFKPLNSNVKVIILDEAHQLSTSAQNALLKETEDVPSHVFIMFCTSAINKIIPALKRRAYIISPKSLINEDIQHLIKRALTITKCSLPLNPLLEALLEYDISSSGLVLQAVEKYISGIPPKECVLLSGGSTLDTMAICRAVSKGDWKTCGPIIATLNKADSMAVLCSVMGYLKTMACKSTGNRSINIARAIDTLSKCNIGDHAILASLTSALIFSCEYMKVTKKVTE